MTLERQEAQKVSDDYVFSFAKRLKGRPLKNAQLYLRSRYVDDQGRWVCYIGKETKVGDFEVHHVGNKLDHRAGNLRTACNSHNAGHHDFTVNIVQGMGTPSSISLSLSSDTTTRQIDINQGLYPEYLKWLENATASTGKVLVDDAIYTAARELRFKLGYGHPKTLREYLKTLVAGQGAPYFVDGLYLCDRSRFEDGKTGGTHKR
ncbi:MAG: hypothetical protein JRN09_09245 [Nitrososphaerota archaeon]|nr:hypothetical protein [Nitrososphaerota archaeon]